MKIATLLSAALLSTIAAGAIAAPAKHSTETNIRNSLFTGPYIGAYGGHDWTDLDSAGFDTETRGWDYGAFAGMRVDGLLDRVNGLGIGLNGAVEGFYGWSNADDNSAGISTEKDNEWGVSFRPGLSFLNSDAIGIAPYGILGYRNTEFEASSGVASSSERYNGFDLGVGTQLLAMGAIGLRAEYTHTWYASENGIDPNSDNVRAGLSYQF